MTAGTSGEVDRGAAAGAGARVVDAEVRSYRLRLTEPYHSASADRTHREGWLLRLEDADGHAGWGESAPLPGRTEALEAAGRALEAAAGALGAGPAPADRLRSALPEETPSAAHAVGVALADLAARRARAPLARRWSGGARPLERVPVNATLPMESPERIAARAREAVDRGFGCLKVKVGESATRDLHRLTAVRREVGPEPVLRLDANAAWSRREARSRLLRMEPYGVDYVEQPLAPDDLDGLGLLRSESGTSVRVAADEAAGSVDRVRTLSERGLVDVVVLKPAVLGAPRRTLEATRIARECGVEVVITSSLGSAVERTAALHLAAAAGDPMPPCGLATGELLAEDTVREPIRPRQGTLPVPLDRPGLGVKPDADR